MLPIVNYYISNEYDKQIEPILATTMNSGYASDKFCVVNREYEYYRHGVISSRAVGRSMIGGYAAT